MASPSVTYVFTNATTADASQVNQCFTDIINSLTDASKDLSISALTCAGNVTMNGTTTTIGNAISDSLVINAYIGSDLVPSANATYDLGNGTNSYVKLHLDNDSTDGGAIYFDAGTTEFIKANAAGTDLALGGFTAFDLAGAEIKEFGLYDVAKAADYTITDIDGVSIVYVTTGAAADKTVTLPTVADSAGRVITIKKVDSDAKKVIVDGEGSETIDGALTVNLFVQYDSITIQSNGTAWYIINKKLAPVVAIYETNVAQSMVDNTDTIVDFEDVVTDSHASVTVGGAWAFTAPRDGTYLVNARTTLFSNAGWESGEFIRMVLYIDGSANKRLGKTLAQASINASFNQEGSYVISLNAAQTIKIYIRQSSGVNINTSGAISENWISIVEMQ